MTEESDRVWKELDGHEETVRDHCKRITTLEQDHKHRDANKNRNLTYILGVIVVLQFIFMVADRLW